MHAEDKPAILECKYKSQVSDLTYLGLFVHDSLCQITSQNSRINSKNQFKIELKSVIGYGIWKIMEPKSSKLELIWQLVMHGTFQL